MVFARTYRTEAEFQAAWPEMLNALQRLHENDLVLPDYRFELAEPELRQVRASARVNVEKALRKFWQFDERFFGNTARDGVACFRWSVYSLAYLAADHRVANDLLSVFVPVLGPYAVKEFGLLFARKVSATFRDEVEQLIWDIQGDDVANRSMAKPGSLGDRPVVRPPFLNEARKVLSDFLTCIHKYGFPFRAPSPQIG